MYLRNFTGMHAMAVAHMDDWYGQSDADIRSHESEWGLPVFRSIQIQGAEGQEAGGESHQNPNAEVPQWGGENFVSRYPKLTGAIIIILGMI